MPAKRKIQATPRPKRSFRKVFKAFGKRSKIEKTTCSRKRR